MSTCLPCCHPWGHPPRRGGVFWRGPCQGGQHPHRRPAGGGAGQPPVLSADSKRGNTSRSTHTSTGRTGGVTSMFWQCHPSLPGLCGPRPGGDPLPPAPGCVPAGLGPWAGGPEKRGAVPEAPCALLWDDSPSPAPMVGLGGESGSGGPEDPAHLPSSWQPAFPPAGATGSSPSRRRRNPRRCPGAAPTRPGCRGAVGGGLWERASRGPRTMRQGQACPAASGPQTTG